MAEIGQIPETPPGVPTGFGLAASGGMLPKLASGQRGSGGTCCPTRVNHLVARRSQEVQARRHAHPDSIRGRAGPIFALAMPVLRFIEPCLPSLADRPPSGTNWIHEIKHDGYRLMARRDSVAPTIDGPGATETGEPMLSPGIIGTAGRPPPVCKQHDPLGPVSAGLFL